MGGIWFAASAWEGRGSTQFDMNDICAMWYKWCMTIWYIRQICGKSQSLSQSDIYDMGWLRLVGSFKLQVSFAEYGLFYRALLRKWPVILKRLLMEATPYGASTQSDIYDIYVRSIMWQHTFVRVCTGVVSEILPAPGKGCVLSVLNDASKVTPSIVDTWFAILQRKLCVYTYLWPHIHWGCHYPP